MSAAISIDSLTRSYGRRRGVERISLAVPEGVLFGFLGPNGAGKTTAIRVLLGFLRPTAGAARIFNNDCWRRSHIIKRDVGYLPGDLRLYSWMNGTQALSIFGAVRGRSTDVIKNGRDLAQRLDLDLNVKVRKMSRGMRQKLGLILALAHRPRLLVLDEPTTGLDPLVQDVVRAMLREMANAGHTIFFSSHTLSEVEQLCDRVAIVREGRIVADDSLEALRRQAGHQVAIRWKDPSEAQTIQPPSFLHVQKRQGLSVHALLDGPLDPLIQWLGQHSVEDLTINRPDLETMFRRFYQSSEAPQDREDAERK